MPKREVAFLPGWGAEGASSLWLGESPYADTAQRGFSVMVCVVVGGGLGKPSQERQNPTGMLPVKGRRV